jgi:hypothetical protein
LGYCGCLSNSRAPWNVFDKYQYVHRHLFTISFNKQPFTN